MKNIAIIGCGRISKNHVQAIANNCEMARLFAVCDIIEEKAEKKADEYSNMLGNKFPSPKVYSDYKDMLEKESSIEMVAIATESGYHFDIAIYCMNKGLHVLVEKPMALSIMDAELMIETAEKNNVMLCVSHQNRFNPPIQKLRKAVEEGRFGKIIAGNARILWNRNEDYYKQAPWRGTYELDGGCLMNQCIHNIDLLQWMLGGEVEWVNGVVGNYMHPYIEAEDYGSVQIKFKNGAIGNIEGTVCIYPSNLEETLTIIGEKGIAVIGGLAVNEIKVWKYKDDFDKEEQVIEDFSGNVENVYGNGHTPLYRDFIDAIINDRKPYIDGKDGKHAVEIILSAYKSSTEGGRINYPPEPISSIDFNR